jgi:hypothetical protein
MTPNKYLDKICKILKNIYKDIEFKWEYDKDFKEWWLYISKEIDTIEWYKKCCLIKSLFKFKYNMWLCIVSFGSKFENKD